MKIRMRRGPELCTAHLAWRHRCTVAAPPCGWSAVLRVLFSIKWCCCHALRPLSARRPAHVCSCSLPLTAGVGAPSCLRPGAQGPWKFKDKATQSNAGTAVLCRPKAGDEDYKATTDYGSPVKRKKGKSGGNMLSRIAAGSSVRACVCTPNQALCCSHTPPSAASPPPAHRTAARAYLCTCSEQRPARSRLRTVRMNGGDGAARAPPATREARGGSGARRVKPPCTSAMPARPLCRAAARPVRGPECTVCACAPAKCGGGCYRACGASCHARRPGAAQVHATPRCRVCPPCPPARRNCPSRARRSLCGARRWVAGVRWAPLRGAQPLGGGAGRRAHARASPVRALAGVQQGRCGRTRGEAAEAAQRV
jgi:hypothetical protein